MASTQHVSSGAAPTDTEALLIRPRSVIVQEVSPRDGLQLVEFVPTDHKVALIEGLVQAGADLVQATSFVHPRAVPQFTDAEHVAARLPRGHGTRFSALIPNLKGAQRARPFEFDIWELMYSATDSHSIRNAGRPSADAMNELEEVVGYAAEEGVEVVGSVGVAFGCPFEGSVAYGAIAEVVGRWEQLGVTTVNLADTIGTASPTKVHSTCLNLGREYPGVRLGLHLHDTRGLALANAVAGLAAGVDRFDSSVGGLGGCPFAPGASGNVASEDLVHLMRAMDVFTHPDFLSLQGLARDELSGWIGETARSTMANVKAIWDLLDSKGVEECK